MSCQFQPIAFGRDGSDQELHAWDPESELEEFFTDDQTIQCECKWGAGLLEKEAALILYLFDKDQTIEVYFPQNVAVGPEREMNSWDVLLSFQPKTLVLAYGDTPRDRARRLKIKCQDDDSLMESLDQFLNQVSELKETSDPAIQQITAYIKNLEKENTAELKG